MQKQIFETALRENQFGLGDGDVLLLFLYIEHSLALAASAEIDGPAQEEIELCLRIGTYQIACRKDGIALHGELVVLSGQDDRTVRVHPADVMCNLRRARVAERRIEQDDVKALRVIAEGVEQCFFIFKDRHGVLYTLERLACGQHGAQGGAPFSIVANGNSQHQYSP